jgi:putative transposase
MTEASLELNEFAEKHLDGDLLRQLGQSVLQKLMEAEVEA